MSFQVIQRGSHTHDVVRTGLLDDDTHEYSLLGRVVQEGDLWIHEVVHWQDIGHTYHRLETSRHRATKKAAVRDLTHRWAKQS